MIQAPIPQNILDYKQKAIGNFSVRELLCGIPGVAIIIFTYIQTGMIENDQLHALVSVLPGLPILLVGFLKPYGVTLEKFLPAAIHDNFVAPPVRLKEVKFQELEKLQKQRSFFVYEDEKVKPAVPSKSLKGIK